jgi:hypothetical protein
MLVAKCVRQLYVFSKDYTYVLRGEKLVLAEQAAVEIADAVLRIT